jgi:hypothetical protein
MNASAKLGRCPVRKDKLPWRVVEGRAIIIHPQGGTVHELNPVGTLIWKNADGNTSQEEIASVIETQFEVETGEAICDVSAFIEDLKLNGLLQE